MHFGCVEILALFINRYLPTHRRVAIADVGALDVNGNVRMLFERPKWAYTGIDMCAGKNVDVVCEPGRPLPIESASYDAVISLSTLEHARNPWRLAEEMCRILRPGGHLCIVAPTGAARTRIHRHPIDAWRFLVDGMRVMAEDNGCAVLEASTHHRDCYCFARKKEVT